MRAFEILVEGRSKRISPAEAAMLLDTTFKDATKGTPIYRGLDSTEDYLLASPKGFDPRPAANTSNHVNLLVDNFASWREYPKRNQSFICTTRASYAEDYGTVYQVYPANNAKIGVCSGDDFWNSFPYLTDLDFFNVSSFSTFLQDFATTDGNNFPGLIKAMDRLGEWFRAEDPEITKPMTNEQEYKLRMFARYKLRFKDFINSKHTFSQFVEELLNPQDNGFQLHTPSTFHNIPPDVEVWTEGPILLRQFDWDRGNPVEDDDY